MRLSLLQRRDTVYHLLRRAARPIEAPLFIFQDRGTYRTVLSNFDDTVAITATRRPGAEPCYAFEVLARQHNPHLLSVRAITLCRNRAVTQLSLAVEEYDPATRTYGLKTYTYQ